MFGAADLKPISALQVAGFPNLFTVTGPGSPSVLCNMPVAIEQHVEWIRDCISYMEENKISSIEATEDSMDKWVAHVNDAANVTLMPHAKQTWYYGANVPGKPRVFMPYAGGMARYRAICNDIAQQNYAGFKLAGAEDGNSYTPPNNSFFFKTSMKRVATNVFKYNFPHVNKDSLNKEKD